MGTGTRGSSATPEYSQDDGHDGEELAGSGELDSIIHLLPVREQPRLALVRGLEGGSLHGVQEDVHALQDTQREAHGALHPKKNPDPGQRICELAPPRRSTRGMWRCWKSRSGQASRERRVGKGRGSSAAPRQASRSAPGCEPRRRWQDYSPGISAIRRLAPACCGTAEGSPKMCWEKVCHPLITRGTQVTDKHSGYTTALKYSHSWPLNSFLSPEPKTAREDG